MDQVDSKTDDENAQQCAAVVAEQNFTRQNSLPTRSASGKRLIYCSDGVIEESDTESMDSSDAEREMVAAETRSEVPDPSSYAPQWAKEADPKRLSWKRWFAYKAVWFGIGSLHCAEVAGEKFAWLFGITSPKYSWEIEEYRRQRRAEKEERQLEMEENEKVRELATRNMRQITCQDGCSVDTENQSAVFTNVQDYASQDSGLEPSSHSTHQNYAYTEEDESDK